MNLHQGNWQVRSHFSYRSLSICRGAFRLELSHYEPALFLLTTHRE